MCYSKVTISSTQIYQNNTHQGKRWKEGREERETTRYRRERRKTECGSGESERESNCQIERQRAHKAIDLAHQHGIMIIGK